MTNENDPIRRGDAIALTLLGDAKTVADAIAALPAVAASQPADPVSNADSRQRVTVKPLVWVRLSESFMAEDHIFNIVAITYDPEKYDTERATRILAAVDVQPDPRDAQIAALVDAAELMAEAVVVECETANHSTGFYDRYHALRAALAAVKGGGA
jgi:hypothetical protein